MKVINLVHLYPKEMNIYGDTGNVLILRKRLERRGFEVKVHLVGAGEVLPRQTDIIVGGGGQDSGQKIVVDDLATKAATLKAMADDGVVMLMICGMYQLFGHHFLTHTGEKLPGIGYLDMVTEASHTRLIGNLTTNTPFGKLVGYENHSGLTTLGERQAPLGRCARGLGNNGVDTTEGAVRNNVFGSYLHGPVLSKSPQFADELISRTLLRSNNYRKPLVVLNDDVEHQAAAVAFDLKR
jgi:CobQ-like glutamine amidotransferase family enzyme